MPSTPEDRLFGITTSVAVKPAAAISADTNITLFGEQTITTTTTTGTNTVTTVPGMRVLLTGQANPVDNGIWIAGPDRWRRAADFDGARDAINGTIVYNVFGDQWRTTGGNDVGEIRIGYDEINFEPINIPDVTLRTELDSESGSGIVSGKKPFTNSTKRTVLSSLSETVSALDFIGSTFTEKLQNAVNWVGSQGGGVVIIPNGIYQNVGKVIITTRRTSIQGQSRTGTVLIGAENLDYIFHYQAPNPGTSYINRYLDGGDVSNMTLIGFDYGESQIDDQVVTHGIYCDGVYKCNYHDISALNLASITKLNGVKDCHFYEWQDGDRQPSGGKKCLKLVECVTAENEYLADNNFYNIHMHAKLGHFDFWNALVPNDGCSIYDNVLFVNNTDLQYHIKTRRMIYSNISRNKFFESRHVGIHLDAPVQVSIDSNLIAIPGQLEQQSGILLTNTDNLSGYGRNVSITNNVINRASGDSIGIYNIDGFVVTGNRSHWPGDQSHFSGQAWGSAVHIRCSTGAQNGTIANNSCGETAYNSPQVYNRASYEVLLESGTYNILVDGQTPYYCQDNGVNNNIICADWKTNNSETVFDATARNLIRNHTRDFSGWAGDNYGASNPVVTYAENMSPTGRINGVSTATFPSTSGASNYSRVRCLIGDASVTYMPKPVSGDSFLFSVWMRSVSGAMRKVVLTVANSSGTFKVSQSFNVGTTWKRYWMEGLYLGQEAAQFVAYIGTENAQPTVLGLFGAKVELIPTSAYVKRSVPSPFDFCQIRDGSTPTRTNGGDCQIGDRFWKNLPSASTSPGWVCTAEGANDLLFSTMPSIS